MGQFLFGPPRPRLFYRVATRDYFHDRTSTLGGDRRFPDNLRGTPRLKSQCCQNQPASERASHWQRRASAGRPAQRCQIAATSLEMDSLTR